MSKPTLAMLIETFRRDALPVNAWVRERGFSQLYVRLGSRYHDTTLVESCCDIANVTAKKPGSGAFTRLVMRLHTLRFNLYVEQVVHDRFRQKLLRMGFKEDRIGRGHPSFWLLIDDQLRAGRCAA